MPADLPTLREVVELVHRRYDPALADDWDRVGLVLGDPADRVGSVLLAVDPVDEVVDEALERGVGLLLTHHPLLLRGVHSVAATSAKGRLVHRLIRGGCGLLTVHTNADNARPGVSDAIAEALGVRDTEPIDPLPVAAMDKYIAFVPEPDTQALIDALAAAGAGRIGDYDRAAFHAPGTGTFRPLAGANPHIGTVGQVESVAESMVQMVAPRRRRHAVVAALLAAHPYEEPAYDVLELAAQPSSRGAGRVGTLTEPITLDDFARRVGRALPPTAHGVRVAGDPARLVQRVAICGGAGDSLLGAAAASGADVYVTSDLRHHRAGEHLAEGGPALVDIAHWAAESLWLPQAAALLGQDAAAAGLALDLFVSTVTTDPWTFRVEDPR